MLFILSGVFNMVDDNQDFDGVSEFDESQFITSDELEHLEGEIEDSMLPFYNLDVEEEVRSDEAGGNVYYLIGRYVEENGSAMSPERIATFYQSANEIYDVERVARLFAVLPTIAFGVINQLRDMIDKFDDVNEDVSEDMSVAAYLAGMLFDVSQSYIDDETQLLEYKRMWMPLLRVLGVDSDSFNSFIESIRQDDGVSDEVDGDIGDTNDSESGE